MTCKADESGITYAFPWMMCNFCMTINSYIHVYSEHRIHIILIVSIDITSYVLSVEVTCFHPLPLPAIALCTKNEQLPASEMCSLNTFHGELTYSIAHIIAYIHKQDWNHVSPFMHIYTKTSGHSMLHFLSHC